MAFKTGVVFGLSAVAAAVFLAGGFSAAVGNASGAEADAAALEKTCAARPGDFLAHFRLACSYASDGRWEDCRRALSECAALRDDKAEVYYDLGVALSHLGAYDKAARSFEEALLLEPGWAAADYNCGLAYYYARQPVNAIKYLREARASAPASPDVLYYLALSYEEIDRRVALQIWREYLDCAARDDAEAPYLPWARRHAETLRVGVVHAP